MPVFNDPAFVFEGVDGFEDGQQIFCLIDAREVEGIEFFVIADWACRYAGEEMVATMSLNRDFEVQMKLLNKADSMADAGNRLIRE